MTTENEERDVFETQCFDPFPQPQTFPAGWDFSELISVPKDEPVTKAADAIEDETC